MVSAVEDGREVSRCDVVYVEVVPLLLELWCGGGGIGGFWR